MGDGLGLFFQGARKAFADVFLEDNILSKQRCFQLI